MFIEILKGTAVFFFFKRKVYTEQTPILVKCLSHPYFKE